MSDDTVAASSPGVRDRARLLSIIGVTVARRTLAPVRRMLGELGTERKSVPTIRCGTPAGTEISLRAPRFADGAEWRRIRLRDRATLERFQTHLPADWDRSHTEAAWVRHCLDARRRVRVDLAVQWVVEIDGRLSGMCELWLDTYNSRGEAGIWLSSDVAGRGVGVAATRRMVEYGFGELRLARIVAPIDVENGPAIGVVRRSGFDYEGTMVSYMEAGGGRHDYQLWAATVEGWR